MNILAETKFIMKKYGITANKKLGQNFLIDDNAVDAIIEASKISKEDLVIEIGPGLGTLTKPLLEKAGKVICIELDDRMLKILENRFNLYNNFELINNDVLKVDGNFAILRTGNIDFTVERSAQTLMGSAMSGEGLVNVFRGTGQIWLAPTLKVYNMLSTGIGDIRQMDMNTSKG